MATAVEKMEGEEAAVAGGELLFCGSTCWDIVGRKKGPQEGNLVSPTRLRPLVGVNIRFVASGCVSCHCVALDDRGHCYTWGRNEKGQLGHGDLIQRDRPTVVSELSKYNIVRAGSGRSHTVVVTEEGQSFAFGWNKHGQLGIGSAKNEIESSPVQCQVSDVRTTACGADFTVWLSSVEGSSILTAGLPQYGQLGHGTDNEWNTKDGSVRLAYEAQPRPKAIIALAGETIVKVACGTNHTVAVDSNGYVYTWGFGGYGRLGHREQKDEWVPRRVDVFQRNNVLPPNAIVAAGSANSACTAGGGQLYMWGKIKSTGDDWMYPKPLMDLSGWNLRCMDSGNMHSFVGADSSCISWGLAQNGELGYGPSGQKSSAVPKKVDILEGMHVLGVACGMGHSMIIVDRANIEDRLDELDIYDGKASAEVHPEPESKKPATNQKSGVEARGKPKKRKKAKSSSDTEEDEVNTDVESDYSEEQTNGKAEQKSKQRGKGKSSTARGRGRPPSTAGHAEFSARRQALAATDSPGATFTSIQCLTNRQASPPSVELAWVDVLNRKGKGKRRSSSSPSHSATSGPSAPPRPSPMSVVQIGTDMVVLREGATPILPFTPHHSVTEIDDISEHRHLFEAMVGSRDWRPSSSAVSSDVSPPPSLVSSRHTRRGLHLQPAPGFGRKKVSKKWG